MGGLQRWQSASRVLHTSPMTTDACRGPAVWTILITLIIEQLLVNIWMYYAKVRAGRLMHALVFLHLLTHAHAKGVNCCAEVRLLLDSGPDGGNCPSVDDCRGFNGTCGELPSQFATVAVMPDYPNGLQDYTCTAFPNDDNSVDSFIVGLISLAIGASCPAGLSSVVLWR